MMNQPVNIEERNQNVLIIDFTFFALFGRGDDDVLQWEEICLFPGHTLKPSIRHQ